MLDSNQRPPPCKGGKARFQALPDVAESPYLSRFLFPGLLRVAGCCAPGGVKVVSTSLLQDLRSGADAPGSAVDENRSSVGRTHFLPSMGDQTAAAMKSALG